MSLIVAFLAGGLAILNPCGFAMLPAFLSLYVGAQEEKLPRAGSRAVQGILVGLLVTAGFLAVFAVIGIPITLGVGQIATAIPWIGFALGIVMAAVAVATLAGKRLELPIRTGRLRSERRNPAAMLYFGLGYGLASLSCTLPIFLVVIGASLTSGGIGASLLVFAAYAIGMAIVLMALSVCAGLLRNGLARTLGRALPHLRWINGSLLLLVSAYLVYYWGSALFVPAEARADDPVVGFIQGFTSLAEGWSNSSTGLYLVLGACAVVCSAGLIALWRWVLKPDQPEASPTCDCEDPAPAATTPTRAPRAR
ncbi:cytochrome c biogenesis CcdA family protein [Amycolatopsis sp. NPDC004747]